MRSAIKSSAFGERSRKKEMPLSLSAGVLFTGPFLEGTKNSGTINSWKMISSDKDWKKG
jgi:hypothetical protein